ncbi:ABC transporter ATP-binding protein [Marinobacterium jannaschii]|uniref:ABC transporter ATP-binding protein n=1 Tax=Marinobacterium jannaschii TaxID=64970 RepID=UPI0004882F84
MLVIEQLSVGYKRKRILQDLSLSFPEGGFTALLGANGCGKTTLLHTLAGLLKPEAGQVVLNGEPLKSLSSKQIARQLAVLPQVTTAPAGLTVRELVMQGRFPWQNWWRQWSDEDEAAVEAAIAATGIADYLDMPLEQLSGGQRQRCWIAMTLAQDTPLLLLDEPTTYLDISHQVELMNLIASLRLKGKTIIAVLHDLNQAATYADHLVMMKGGNVYAQGDVDQVFTPQNLKAVFDLDAHIISDPHSGNPIAVPLLESHLCSDLKQVG